LAVSITGRSSGERTPATTSPADAMPSVVSHRGEWEHALRLTARGKALYDELDRPWDQAANALLASRAAISAGDRVRAAAARDQVQHRLRSVDDPWLHVRRDAMLGELARVEHRFGDAVRHIGRAAEMSGRLGFLQTEAYQLSTSDAPSARPATTRRARPRWSSRSSGPKRSVTCAWRRSPASISGASCARSAGSRRRGRRSKRPRRGTRLLTTSPIRA
jgi:hypothetical protein